MKYKFRVWNKGMHYFGFRDIDGSGKSAFILDEKGGACIDCDESTHKIMQYTGLHDKNGKEIYEGDIVSYYDSTTMWSNSYVKEVGGAFAIVTEENSILLYNFIGDYEYNGESISEIEVIGNIYENPNLLNEGK